ncbi:hypothetical protein BKA93DRAFT_615948 [Sparassis latifolia]
MLGCVRNRPVRLSSASALEMHGAFLPGRCAGWAIVRLVAVLNSLCASPCVNHDELTESCTTNAYSTSIATHGSRLVKTPIHNLFEFGAVPKIHDHRHTSARAEPKPPPLIPARKLSGRHTRCFRARHIADDGLRVRRAIRLQFWFWQLRTWRANGLCTWFNGQAFLPSSTLQASRVESLAGDTEQSA